MGGTVPQDSSVLDADPEVWERTVALNLGSALWLTQALFPGLRAAGRASVVHNASVDSLLANPNLPLYSIAKGGMVPMTHTMAHEFAPFGVRVNCIAPGSIQTGMLATMPSGPREALLRQIPSRRFGTPLEAARVALFLLSTDSSYVNGVVIPVESGRLAITPGTA